MSDDNDQSRALVPEPEFGPAMRSLNPRWQKAVVALFLTEGNRAAALRMAGYKGKPQSIYVMASKIFADDRVRQAIREEAAKQIDIAEPEVLSTVLSIMRNADKRDIDRLRAAEMLWSRSNPVLTKHKIEVTHTLTNEERDIQHYRALKRIGAPQDAFIARFGTNGLARVEAMIAAEDEKQRKIAADAGATIDGEFEEVNIDNDQ